MMEVSYRIWGTMYGEDTEATWRYPPVIKDLYGYKDDVVPIESKMFLFAMQTFFNIFLKLLF